MILVVASTRELAQLACEAAGIDPSPSPRWRWVSSPGHLQGAHPSRVIIAQPDNDDETMMRVRDDVRVLARRRRVEVEHVYV